MNSDLQQLEREVEAARERVAEDATRLRARHLVADVKHGAKAEFDQVRQQVVQKAKDAGRRQMDGLLAELKARVAANPGAALAIGAGLAWHLLRHPPVATVLVGAGAVALWRTDPNHPAAGSEVAGRAAHLLESARERVEDFAADPAGRLSQLTDAAKDRMGALAQSATDHLSAAAEAIGDRAGEWPSQVETTAKHAFRQSAETVQSWSEMGKEAVSSRIPEASRDQYLLGVAALALAASVGIAGQRRLAGRD